MLEKAMATHSSTLAWKIPWMEESGGLQSMGSLRVGHDWATSLSLFTFMHWKGNGNPLQCSCLENPRDGGAWWASVYGVAQSWTWLMRLSSSSSPLLWTSFHLGHHSALSRVPCAIQGKWKWSHSVVSDSLWPHGLQPTRLLHAWDFPGKSTRVGCHCLLRKRSLFIPKIETDLSCSGMNSLKRFLPI